MYFVPSARLGVIVEGPVWRLAAIGGGPLAWQLSTPIQPYIGPNGQPGGERFRSPLPYSASPKRHVMGFAKTPRLSEAGRQGQQPLEPDHPTGSSARVRHSFHLET